MRIIQAHTTVTIMTNVQYAKQLLRDQFTIKAGTFNNRSEAMGFSRIHFFDATKQPVSLYQIPISIKSIARRPIVCN